MIDNTFQSPLDLSVLVLNKHYMALRIIRVRRAITLLFRELAEVISCEDDTYCNYDFSTWQEISQYKHQFQPQQHDWLTTVNNMIAVPRIIRLLEYDSIPKHSTVRLNRKNLFARDKHRCQYCNKKVPTTELSIDHVIPRSMGGKTTWQNVVCACTKCNCKKGARTPHQANMKLIKHPVQPKKNPTLSLHLSNNRYKSWKKFLDYAYWSVELK